MYADVGMKAESASELHEYITHLESQLKPRKTVNAHDCVLSGNKVVGINKNPTRKTVSDAVDLFREWKRDGFDYLFWHEKLGFIYRESMDVPDCYVYVCTREEFEAEVERRNGEIATGEMPELIEGDCIDCDGQRYYVYFNGMYYNVGGEQFMGIPYIAEKVTRAGQVIWKRKPPITHKEIIEMMERAAFVNWTVADFMQHVNNDFEVE